MNENADNALRGVNLVILSTADFDSAVWTNKQHLASRLSALLPVIYVGSIGLRRPRMNQSDVRRIVDRVISWVRRRRASGESGCETGLTAGLVTLKPVLIPFHQFRLVAIINRQLIRIALKKVRSCDRSILWTFSPITLGIEKDFDSVIYHSVDLLHEVPGTPTQALLDGERSLLNSASTVIASSHGVRDHLMGLHNRDVLLWENVADTALFKPRQEEREDHAIFAGHLTPEKIDMQLLRSYVEAGGELVLAGPVSVDGSILEKATQDLLKHPRVTYLGNLPLPKLAEAVRKSKVGLIPYRQNPYTEGVFPMKVYEYLGAGLAVVSTPISCMKGRKIYGLEVVSDMNFADAAIAAVNNFREPEATQRSAAAFPHSWANRTDQALSLLKEIAK